MINEKIKLESEIVQVSMYCEIVENILCEHKKLSVVKTLLYAYLIKNNHFLRKNIYSGNNKNDLMYKSISMLSGNYENFCESIEFILKAIHLLLENDRLHLENEVLLFKNSTAKDVMIYKATNFLNNAISESQRVDDKQFLKEVLQIV